MAPSSPPSPSPSDPEETSAAAAGSSTGSSGGSEFFADAGPGFDADAPPAPPPVDQAPALELAWDVTVVEGCLTAQGQVVHTAIGKSETDWLYTRDELRAIAPPLTRILNRYDATRAAAGTGDEIALILGLTGYVGRSVQERRAVLQAERAEEEEASGGPAFETPDGAPLVDFDAELPDTPPITPATRSR